MESSKRIFYSRAIFITGIILLTSLSVLFVYETYQENSSSDAVQNTNLIRQSLEKIHSSLKEDESSLRGYALTKDVGYLGPRLNEGYYDKQLFVLDSLIEDHDIQNENFLELKIRVNRSVRNLDTIALQLKNRKYSGSPAFFTDLRNGSADMDSIRSIVFSMQSNAMSLAASRQVDAKKHTLFATMVGVAASIFSMIVFVVAFYFIDQELKRSQNYINKTETLNSKIADINKELEQANRSLQKLNSELESKNIQLEKTAAELSSFTHITSHDMQEPLRKIEFFISVVEEREKQNLSDEGKKFLEKIRQSVSRMRQLFLSMLDFSLTNTVDNTIEEVDLNGVLEQTLGSLKVYIKDTNAFIDCDDLPTVKGIQYQLIQLFENVISNAIKFRRKDIVPEIIITFETVRVDSNVVRGLKGDSDYYKIDFRDNGIGFDQKHSEKIFEIFHRLISRNDTYGVGIGLSICRKIAENHGGMIIANSEPGVGSVFSLYIPC
jgi:signal transduction histidine kinase